MSMMMLECGSDSILSKRKCESEFAEVEEATKKKATAGENENEKENVGVGGGEKGKGKVGPGCAICSEDDHFYDCCPWHVRVPQGIVPLVGPRWIVVCKYCHTDSDELKPCAITGSNCIKRVEPKICACCLKIGHLFEDCEFYNKIELEDEGFDHPEVAPIFT
ncbi:hypothetical protein OROGR_013246 [Orobanche gracilis]